MADLNIRPLADRVIVERQPPKLRLYQELSFQIPLKKNHKEVK